MTVAARLARWRDPVAPAVAAPRRGLRERTGPRTALDVRLLQVTACGVVALSPLEGYLQDVQGQLGKVPSVLFVLTWAAVRLRQRRLPVVHPVHLLLAGLGAAVLISAAAHTRAPYALEYTGRWLPFVVICALLVDVAAREVPPRALLAAMVLGAVAAGAGALYSFVVEGDPRATGPMADPNDLACTLVGALPLLLAFDLRRSRGTKVALLLLAAAVLVAGAVATFSRGGIVALVVGLVYLVVRRVVPIRAVLGAAAVAAAVLAAVALLVPGQVDRALGEKFFIGDSNVDQRELRWQAAARMLAENPVLGVGPGGFRSEYVVASNRAELTEQTPVAHSMYLEVGGELGLPALLLFLGMIAWGLIGAERALRTGTDPPTAVAIQAAIVTVAVASVFLSEQYYLSIWALVAIACGAQLRNRGVARWVSG